MRRPRGEDQPRASILLAKSSRAKARLDPLSELLASVRATSASWSIVDARTPWRFALRGRPSTFTIHHVVSGMAQLSMLGHDAEAVAAGEIVVVPRGLGHALRDSSETPTIPLEEMSGSLTLGVKGTVTRITSVQIELDDPFSTPIMSSLPPVVRLAGATGLVEQLNLLANEIEARPFGSDLVLDRMADVLFVHVMRAYLETFTSESSHSCRSLERVGALRDPGVATALGSMSRRPEHAWTVASLAEEAGLSRSGFAARFTSLVGEPPLAFLTRVRMQKATTLLRERATLAKTSQLTGYATEASFSHAFRQWSGMAPGAYRRTVLVRGV